MKKRADQPQEEGAKSSAQRQADLRARRSAMGLKELRNLFAYPEDHERIKRYVARLVKDRSGA